MPIERTEYLKMCQRISLLKNGICNIKENVPDELLVLYNNNKYYPQAYEMRFDNGKTINIAILHDLKANSTIHIELERVEKYEQKRNN